MAKPGSLSYSDQYNSGGAMVRSASTAVATPCQTESNSSDFHKIAIFLQSVAAILMPVALLTGRVYQDGLGGLRAVLFYFCQRSSPPSLESDMHSLSYVISTARLITSAHETPVLTIVNSL